MADDKKVRVRFAPSPTGKLHIGGARTAIYNWAFARSSGGDFILRIEDTDPTRSTEENTRIILRAMKWLGLDWDEGPETGGDFGPYFQTQRTDTYQKALDYLLEHDCAYPCFCTKEELDEKRKAAEKEQGGYAGYDGTCRCLTPEEAQKRIDAGEPCVWRIKVPKDHGPVEFEDAVYGHMSFPIDVMDDMILKRSDGTFTYNFAVVCDDINMDITHVIRGDDHLSNTPRQVLVYEALGAGVPMFAHLPMILGQDGQKLSKRHGATSVEEYKEEGYLPEALVNYLALLGWSLDGETTIIPPKTLCKDFTLERISKKHAIFDPQKLDWMDGVYLRELDARDWTEAARPWIAQAMALGSHIDAGAHIVPELDARQQRLDEFGHSSLDWDEAYAEALATIEEQPDVFELYYPLFVERINRLDEIALRMQYLFWGPNVLLDEKSVNKILKKENSRADEALKGCRKVLADPDIPWEVEALQDECKKLTETLDIKARNLFQPLRVAVCGNMVSPPLFESIELMKREDVISRIDSTMDLIFGPGA